MTLAPNLPPFHDHPFSIASAPSDLPRLRLVIRESGDCTNEFGHVRPGTQVAIDGPHGSFVLPEGEAPVIMVAGGAGIAPLLGMLEEAVASKDPRSLPPTLCGARSNSVGWPCAPARTAIAARSAHLLCCRQWSRGPKLLRGTFTEITISQRSLRFAGGRNNGTRLRPGGHDGERDRCPIGGRRAGTIDTLRTFRLRGGKRASR